MGLRFNIDIGIKSQGAGQAAGDVRKVSGEAAKAGKTINTINASLVKMSSLVGVAFSVREITQFVASTVRAASDVQEMQSLLEVTFGRAVDDVREWAAETSGAVGRSRFELLRFAGDFAAFMKPLGTAPAQIRPMSQELAQLTVDLASFRNLAEEDVLTKLMSGLAGETEAVRRLGVDLSAAAVEQELLAQGIDKTNAEATQAEKVMARYAILMRQTADAQGDAVRTSDGLANMQRRLEGILFDLRVEIGRQLLPIITEMAQDLAEFSKTQEFEDTLEDIGEAARTAAELVQLLVNVAGKLADLGEPLADFFNRTQEQEGPDPSALRAWANLIGAVERFLTFDQVGETAIAGRIREQAREIEEAAQKVRESKSDFDLSGVLKDADRKIAELTADQMRRIGVETERAAQLSEEAMREAEAAAKKYQERVKDLKREIDPVGTRLRELGEEAEFAWKAFRDDDLTLQELTIRLHQLGQEAADLAPEIEVLSKHLEDLPKAVAPSTAFRDDVQSALDSLFPDDVELRRLDDMRSLLEDAYDSGILGAEAYERAVEAVNEREAELGKAGQASFAEWMEIAQQASGVVGQLNSDVGNAVQSLLAMVAAFHAIAAAASTAEAASGWIALIGAAIGLIAGLGGGGSTTKGETPAISFDGLLGDLSELQEVAGAGLEALGFDISGFTQGLIDQLRAFETAWADQMGAVMQTIGLTTDQLVTDFDVIARTHIFEDKVTQTWRVIFDGIETTFEDAATAAAFAIRETLRRSDLSNVAEAVRQIIGSESISLDNFEGALQEIQRLADQAAISLDGVSATQLELQRLGPELDALTMRLTQMGLSADQVERLVGGQLIASMQALRQQITGGELSVEQRQAIQKANAEMFNAERALRIAELEARRAGLEAQLNLTRAEIELIRQGVKSYAEALKAKGEIYNAEIELIIKQIEAINKVLEALGNIPEINIGTLRLPGVPRIPAAPRVPPPVPTGPSDVEDASRAAREAVDELIRSLDEMTTEMVANINELKSSIADLQRFREGLLVGNLSPLPLAGQLEEAERQLREAAAAARSGDIEAFGDVQQLSQQFLQLLAGTFGTSGAKFQAGFRFVDELIGDLIEEGNRLVESETELLRAMRNNTADQLAAQREQLGLTRDEIKEIRTGWERQVEVQNNILDKQDRLETAYREENAALRRAIQELAEANAA